MFGKVLEMFGKVLMGSLGRDMAFAFNREKQYGGNGLSGQRYAESSRSKFWTT